MAVVKPETDDTERRGLIGVDHVAYTYTTVDGQVGVGLAATRARSAGFAGATGDHGLGVEPQTALLDASNKYCLSFESSLVYQPLPVVVHLSETTIERSRQSGLSRAPVTPETHYFLANSGNWPDFAHLSLGGKD
jgi:hypothetical protein